jgi:hypothetical protein
MNESLPNRSARILGWDHGLNAVEMNLALKAHGFLEGEPGAYRVTEKGLPFATETFESRGTGGYPQYNPSWETRTWDPSITDELDITDELKQSVRAEATLLRQRQAEARAASSNMGESGGEDGFDVARQLDRKRLMIGVAIAIGITASAYAIWKLRERQQRAKTQSSDPSKE